MTIPPRAQPPRHSPKRRSRKRRPRKLPLPIHLKQKRRFLPGILRGDELWLWQSSAAMALTIGSEVRLLGPDPSAGQELQVLVPGGQAQSASTSGEGEWSLVACVVTPGFDYEDFELLGYQDSNLD